MGHRKLLTWTNRFAAALFVASAALQYNDPDPLRWAALYSGAALVCLLWRAGRWGIVLAALVGAVALAWAATLAPAVLPELRVGDLFGSMKASTPTIEEGRELLGLLLVAGWMTVLLVAGLRARQGQPRD